MHFVFWCIVHCNSMGCDLNSGKRCFISLLSLGGFGSSLGIPLGRIFIQSGAFAGCPSGMDPVKLLMGEGGPKGAAGCGFPEPAAPAVVVACVVCSIGRVRLVDVIKLSGCKLIQDLENGLYQELIAFILVLKR